MDPKSKGSYEGWEGEWQKQAGTSELNKLFTTAKPGDILQFWQRAYGNDLIQLIDGKGYQKFCELGSGRGTTSMYLAQAGYTDITMVDLATTAFEIAKSSFKHYDFPIPEMVLANVEDTPLPSGEFDCIYNIGLLEHFEDPGPTLAESFRLLKSGGMIFMPIVPEMPVSKSIAQHLLFSPVELLKKTVKGIIGKKKKSSNILRTELGADEYVDICRSLGFKRIRCLPYNPYWQVNKYPFFRNKVTFPIYQWYYNAFKKGTPLSFETGSGFNLCLLLIAEK